MFENIMISDIASFDINPVNEDDIRDNLHMIIKQMKDKNYDVQLVKNENNDIKSYMYLAENGEYSIKQIELNDVVPIYTSLDKALYRFKKCEYLFGLENDKITGIITRADLAKSMARVYIFGLITCFESFITDEIRSSYTNEEIKTLLNDERIEKANKIFEERKNNNLDLSFCDCLQLADKKTIVIKNKKMMENLGFESKEKSKSFFRCLEKIRNGIAHSQVFFTKEKFIEVIDCIKMLQEIDENIQKMQKRMC
jgi:CBS domain-containing protein